MLPTRWICGLVMALLCVVSAEAQDGAGKDATAQKPPAESTAQLHVSPGAVNVRVGEYWLGVNCRPVGELLRSHFGIAENQGLVVHLVVPDSPADAAGIRRHDILLTADGKPLSEIIDVMEAVNATEGTELKIEMIRAGKRHTITVKPAKRPKHVVSAVPRKKGEEKADWDTIQKWLQKVEPGELGEGPKRFRFIRPGTILPPGARLKPAMPSNLRITITKLSDKPATVVVQRGEDEWTVTENDLDKLPDDIRPHVEPLLGRKFSGLIGHIPHVDRAAPGSFDGHEHLEARMDEILNHIDQLHRLIEGLSNERSRQNPPKVETPE